MQEEKKTEHKEGSPLNSMKDTVNLINDVIKYAGTAVVVMGGLVLMVKLGKVMLKDIKGTGV
jgi:hypothetical protein